MPLKKAKLSCSDGNRGGQHCILLHAVLPFSIYMEDELVATDLLWHAVEQMVRIGLALRKGD